MSSSTTNTIANEQPSNDETNENNNSSTSQLGDKVIKAVRESPNYTIKPTRLATLLGISVDDANAELCGLLSAVGNEATFTFEEIECDGNKKHMTMVFQFPSNFERRAKSYRRRQLLLDDILLFLSISYKYLKVIIAFGLIVSLFVLIIAVLLVLVSVTIAMLTQERGNRNNTAMMSHRIRSLLLMLREMLWFYAIFGGMFENEETSNPFLREIAGSMSMLISVFYGNPFHPAYWMRRSRLFSSRRNRMQRGWGNNRFHSFTSAEGTWNNEEPISSNNGEDGLSDFPGLISIAAEFLFGSSSFLRPLPSTQDKWRLRALVIASKTSGIISIKEILPYVDYPPSIQSVTNDKDSSMYYALSIISHFNGKPINKNVDEASSNDTLFHFPEVIAESECGGLPYPNKIIMENEEDISGLSILYKTNTSQEYIPLRNQSTNTIPKYLKERKYTLTQLTPKNFTLCVTLGIVNYIGIVWLKNAILEGGVLELSSSMLGILLSYIVSFLYFYAKLFLLLPVCRLVAVLVCNLRIDYRNGRRLALVGENNDR